MGYGQHSAGKRRFLQQSACLTAAALLPVSVQARSDRISRAGLQLFTLRREMSLDLEGTLARVAELGYREVEFAGYFGRSAREMRRVLQANGLISPAAHIPLDALRNNLQAELDFAAEVGQRYLVLPSVPGNERTVGDYLHHAETLNRAGEAARPLGLKMGYHNHSFEFDPISKQVPYEILLTETDPDLVGFELDLFWITHAGVDPLLYLASHPGRFPLLHLKDRDKRGRMVDVGQGTIDFAGILARGGAAGFRHFFVEHDSPADGIASVARSLDALRELRF